MGKLCARDWKQTTVKLFEEIASVGVVFNPSPDAVQLVIEGLCQEFLTSSCQVICSPTRLLVLLEGLLSFRLEIVEQLQNAAMALLSTVIVEYGEQDAAAVKDMQVSNVTYLIASIVREKTRLLGTLQALPPRRNTFQTREENDYSIGLPRSDPSWSVVDRIKLAGSVRGTK